MDTKKLENDRAQLKKQLNSNKLTYTFWLVFAGIVLMLLIIYSYRKNREQKQWKQKFNELLGAIEKQKHNNLEDQTTLAETTTVSATAQEAKVGLQNDISAQQVNEQRLFKALKKFEQEKGFLNLIESEDGSSRALRIEDLAAQLGTNRTTLSNFLNTHKGGFANYLTKLRINQVMIDLTQQEALRKHSVQELVEMYGFSSLRSFNLQFKTETGLPPSYFMKQLELNLS
ncbi:MAG TPA: helix-turn-helix domain-containing protein [Flavobacterium sp.]|nr:helix-turn-helix domain-containing protein [Flavobacterium sp.]